MNESFKLLLQTWAWDCLYTLDGQKELIQSYGFNNTQITQFIQADTWFDADDEGEKPYSPIAAREKIKQAAQQWFEQNDFEQLWQNGIPDVLHDNIAEWQKLFQFNETEIKLLTFTVLLYSQSWVAHISRLLGDLDYDSTIRTLSVLLRLPENEVAAALQHDATLANTGLLKIDYNDDFILRHKLNLLSKQFADLMTQERLSPLRMLKEHIQAAPTTQLTLDDFTHLGDLNAALVDYLKHVVAHQQKGCNILIHGIAGMGKTEYTRALSQALGVELFEISWENGFGTPADRNDRLNALRMAQHILWGSDSFVMSMKAHRSHETTIKSNHNTQTRPKIKMQKIAQKLSETDKFCAIFVIKQSRNYQKQSRANSTIPQITPINLKFMFFHIS